MASSTLGAGSDTAEPGANPNLNTHMTSWQQNPLQRRNNWTFPWLVTATWMLVLAATFLTSHCSGASTYTWTNTSSGSYTNPVNWDLNALPGSADTALLANNGTALYDSTMSNLLTTLLFGGIDGSSGNITMSGGVLSITNNANANLFLPGYYNNSSGTFTLNGGTFTIARPSTSNRYFQDGFQPGFGAGSSGTVVVNNGLLNILCGMEIGIDGAGTLTVNGGTVLDNGWFTVGRGGALGSGFFNLTAGTVYHLRNPGTDSRLRIQYATGVNGTANISGGTLYTPGITLCANNSAGTATLNVSGGTIYLGEGGVSAGNLAAGGSVKIINVSGGTFRTVMMYPNAAGQGGVTNVFVGGPGTNWTWNSANMPVVNLTTSPGSGTVTFAPEAAKTITLNNVWDGPGAFAITGPGTLAIGASNTYVGGTTVGGGTLLLNVNQSSSLLSGTVVGSGGTLALGTAELSSPMGSATFNSGSTLSLVNNALLTDSTLTLPSGVTLAFNASNTQLLTNNVAGAGNVSAALSGNGVEVVTGTLAHTGSTTVTAGILDIAGTLNSSTGVLVTNTGTLAGNGLIGAPITIASTTSPTSAHLRLGLSPLNVPGTLTVSNLTLGAGSEMDVKLGTATTVGSGVNDLLVVNGNLTINSNAFLNIVPLAALTPSTYVIATYIGTLTGQFTNSIGGLTRYGFALDYSTPGQIKLNVTGSNASLAWVGVTNSVAATSWDVITTPNWTNLASLLADTFREGDAVTFDDSARNTNVVVATTLLPASITFNGNTNWSFTGSGSGRISGGTGITKNGNGTVLMAAGLGVGNDYTGPVNINGGILKMNGALSLGATNGATTVASGATLDLNGQTPNDEPIVLQGAGFNGTSGAINNSSATAPSQNNGPRRVTLAGDTTINASGNRWDMGFNTLGAGGGSFAGNGFKLTKIGAQQIWMHELGDIGVGDILVNQGTLGFQFTIGLGNPANTITVMPGATFGIWQAPPLSKQTVLTNGATLYSDGASNALSGSITLYGTNTLLLNQSLGLLGSIAGSGGYQKTGGGTLYLAAANTYSGSTLVNAGTLILGPAGSIANSVLVNLATNTVLDATLPAAGLTLASGQTISGSGSVKGNASAGTGAQIAPGSTAAAGTLTFNNDLALSGDTNLLKLSSDPFTVGNGVNDLVNVLGSLTLSGVSTIQINPLGVLNTSSPYSVMQYASGSPTTANFHVVSGSPRYNVTLVDPATTPSSIQVTLTGNPGVLLWKGGAASKPNAWDSSTTNWLNLGTTLRDAYFGGDQAILDDSATINTIVLSTAAVGSTISLSNNTKAYTLTGSGSLASILDMEGTGSLRLAVSNAPNFSAITANSGTLIYDVQGVPVFTNTTPLSDNGAGLSTIVKANTNTMILSVPDNTAFSGALVISNGILQFTNALALGGAGSIYATNTGSLDINAIPSGAKTVVVAGSGYNGLGAVLSSASAGIANEGVHNLTLVGDASISASNRWDIFGGTGGSLTGNGFKLTHLGAGAFPGPGVILINSVGETGLGDIHVVAGRLGFQGYATMGDTSKTLTVESNAVVTLFSVSPADNKNLVMNGSATFDSGGSANTFNGPVTLVGTSNLFGLRVDLHLEAAVGGAGGLTVGDSPVGAGGGTLYLDAANTYTGPTLINSGHAIIVGAGSSLGSSSLIQVNSGATLDLSAPASFTLGAGQKLIGAGSVNGGNIVFGPGSTLAPGFPDNTTSTLSMSGNLTLQSGSTNLVVVNKTTSVANDTISGLTSVTIAGTLVITNVGSPLAAGDAIQLFTSSGYSGAFDQIIPASPGSGLTWDLSTLNTDGKLRVAPIRYPNISGIVVGGGKIVLTGTNNGSASTHYSVLSTTNVAQPLNQWQSLVTNPFNLNGSFSWTNPVAPGEPSRFYRLQLQ